MPKRMSRELGEMFMRMTMGSDYGKADPPTAPVDVAEVFRLNIQNLPAIRLLHLNPGLEREFHEATEGQDHTSLRIVRATLLRLKADDKLAAKKYVEARDFYMRGADTFARGAIPHKDGYLVQNYLEMGMSLGNTIATLCATGAARCMLELKEYEQALVWSSEVDVMQRHAQYSAVAESNANKVEFEWMDFGMNIPDYYKASIHANFIASEAYYQLGNTGAAAERHETAIHTATNMPPRLADEVVREITFPSKEQFARFRTLRHPDAATVHKQTLIAPNLQIRGSWAKINLKNQGGPSSRIATSCFAFKGNFYVFGGEREAIGPYYDEMWCLNLEARDKWRRLDSYPFPRRTIMCFSNYAMTVDAQASKAYLFIGRQTVDYFDLTTEKWGRIKTTYGGAWPYTSSIKNFNMHCVEGKMYVFGGKHDASRVGTNLLMVLDLASKEWTRLAGSEIADTPDFYSPGPRENACSWVSKDKRRIYVYAGNADRLGAKMLKCRHPSDTTYDYEDMWSWDIAKKSWRKERITGNRPCKRTEMACVYNPVLDKVITFGGYSPRVPTAQSDTVVFHFSYYADSFMLDSDDPSKSSFKHIITRGFPTYRAMSHLVADETTGKTYLFSGYTNSEFVPSRNSPISRNFADLWQLKLDLDKGDFEGVDLEEESRTAKAGPWQRCFNCGSAGPWQKCGGSCKGKAFFCNSICLKEGWRQHKESHKCRKA